MRDATGENVPYCGESQTGLRYKDLTLREAAQSALDVQDASNASGIVFEFARAMQALCDAGFDTHTKNTHPIVTLFVSKLADLNDMFTAGQSEYRRAQYEACQQLAKRVF